MSNEHTQRFFDEQFARQVAAGEFALNPFEVLALEHARGRVVDLGCGLGNFALAAARQGCDVVAYDASHNAIERLRAAAAREHLAVDARLCDLAEGCLLEPCDTAVAIGLFMFFERTLAWRRLFDLAAIVRPGGRLLVNVLIVGTTFTAMFDPRGHHLFEPSDLERAFAGWETLLSRRDTFAAPGDTHKVFATFVWRRRDTATIERPPSTPR